MKRYTPIQRFLYHSDRKKLLAPKYPRTDRECNQLDKSIGFLVGWSLEGCAGSTQCQKGIAHGRKAAKELNDESNKKFLKRQQDRRK